MSYVCDRVFANKCLNRQPCVQFIFSPRCESDMILSVMTHISLKVLKPRVVSFKFEYIKIAWYKRLAIIIFPYLAKIECKDTP